MHFNISKDAHAAFRIACFQRQLSMQEVFEDFVQYILAEDPKIIRMLDQLSDDKKNKVEKKFSKQDVESIFDLIENNNRIKD